MMRSHAVALVVVAVLVAGAAAQTAYQMSLTSFLGVQFSPTCESISIQASSVLSSATQTIYFKRQVYTDSNTLAEYYYLYSDSACTATNQYGLAVNVGSYIVGVAPPTSGGTPVAGATVARYSPITSSSAAQQVLFITSPQMATSMRNLCPVISMSTRSAYPVTTLAGTAGCAALNFMFRGALETGCTTNYLYLKFTNGGLQINEAVGNNQNYNFFCMGATGSTSLTSAGQVTLATALTPTGMPAMAGSWSQTCNPMMAGSTVSGSELVVASVELFTFSFKGYHFTSNDCSGTADYVTEVMSAFSVGMPLLEPASSNQLTMFVFNIASTPFTTAAANTMASCLGSSVTVNLNQQVSWMAQACPAIGVNMHLSNCSTQYNLLSVDRVPVSGVGALLFGSVPASISYLQSMPCEANQRPTTLQAGSTQVVNSVFDIVQAETASVRAAVAVLCVLITFIVTMVLFGIILGCCCKGRFQMSKPSLPALETLTAHHHEQL